MIWVLLLTLIAVVGFGYYGSRKRQFERRPKLIVDDHVTFPIKDFRGSSISLGEHACGAVKRIEGKRFLMHETPAIPVEGCDAKRCECSYIQFEDRRSGDENRRKTFSARPDGRPGYAIDIGTEKRKAEQDRRKQ